MAGLCVAARIGLEMPKEEALAMARDKYVDIDIHKAENAARLEALDCLPASCVESAACLERVREVYEADGVFPPRMIDGIIRGLREFKDADLRQRVAADPNLMRALVKEYFYCG
jgi:glutamine synthetase